MKDQRMRRVLGRGICLAAVLTLGCVYASAQNKNSGSHAKTFSVASVEGSYGITYNGTILNAAGFSGPLAATGQIVADGKGNLQGSETFNVDGTICEGAIAGTYTVNADGTGQIRATFTPATKGCPSGTTSWSVVLVDGGQEVFLCQTESDKVLWGEARKQ